MSNESPKRIERMLRKWARNRRDAAGAGWSVHPATRRLLQGEVARTFGAARVAAGGAEGGGRGWLGWGWVRLALGGGALAAVLVLAARVWWPRSPATVGELAQAHAPVVLTERADRADRTDRTNPTDRPTLEPMVVATPLDAAKVAPKADSAADGRALALAKAPEALPTRAEVQLLKEMSPKKSLAVLAKAKDAGEIAAGKPAEEGGKVASAPVKLLAEKTISDVEFEATDLKRATPLAVVPRPTPVHVAPPAAMAPSPVRVTTAPTLNDPAGPAAALPPRTVELLQARDDASRLARVANPVPAPGLPEQPVSNLGAAVPFARPAASAAPAAPTPAPAAAMAMALTATARLPESNAQMAQQNFLRVNAANLYRRNLQSPPVPAVLNEFQLQRAGDSVTVVDEDGSVYSGQVLNAEPAGGRAGGAARSLGVNDGAAATAARQNDSQEAAKRERAPGADMLRREQDKGGAEAAGYWFQAIGTNRSVNQRVVFTGNYLPSGAVNNDAPAAARGAKQNDLAPAAGSRGNAGNYLFVAPTGAPQQAGGAGEAQGRVTGRVRVGLSNDIQVEAVSPVGQQRR